MTSLAVPHGNSVGTENGPLCEIKLKRQISLQGACALIMGIVIGSGIFVSPKGVLEQTGSIGLALVIWFFSGLFATLGSLCYAELGTSIPKSGGDYIYINEAFGHMPAFLFLWIALTIINPTANAIVSLTFANYILKPLYPTSQVPENAIRLLAACIICLLTFINCYNVKWATKAQTVVTIAKVVPLGIIIVTGIYHLLNGNTEYFEMPNFLANTKANPSQISVAFYSSIFSYAGWNYLNYVTEELKDPIKNLPRAICISLPSVTLIYMLTNIAYFAVLSTDEILDSSAVAMSFASKVLGPVALLMPTLVSISCIGGINGCIFGASRMFFVGAREGQMPELLAMINLKFVTPMPSLLLLGAMSLFMIIDSDVIALINHIEFAETFVFGLAVVGLLWMRYKRPDMPRPIKMNLLIPVVFVCMCVFMVAFPFFSRPMEMLTGVFMILSGLPVYLIFVHWKNKPQWLYKPWVKFTHIVQKFLWCVPENESKTY